MFHLRTTAAEGTAYCVPHFSAKSFAGYSVQYRNALLKVQRICKIKPLNTWLTNTLQPIAILSPTGHKVRDNK